MKTPPSLRPSMLSGEEPLRAAAQGRGALRAALLLCCGGALLAAGPAYAEALAAPAMSGPLAANPDPMAFDAGPLGQVSVTGQISGVAAIQGNATHAGGIGNKGAFADLSNAQIEIQTTQGPLQFYVQAGAYSLPSLGTSYMRATDATDQLFGPVPVAYAKALLSPAVSIMAGLLPTMVGAESTFTFQNINIERGLLWNQEPAISRGAQVNYTRGPISAALSLNDGYFSGKLNWLSGTLSYAIDPSNSITVVGAGSLSGNGKTSAATPLAQNNNRIFNLIFNHAQGPLSITPYLQYSHVKRDGAIGIDRSARSYGGAVLAKYALGTGWSLGARGEYLKTTGGDCGAQPNCTPTNLLYGVKSDAWSLTLTPSYQSGIFFARGELSYTRIAGLEAGYGFGRTLDRTAQARSMVETGILF